LGINHKHLPSMLLSTREGDPKGWHTVLVTVLGSVLGKPVPRSHSLFIEEVALKGGIRC
jgi:hypothetical protein